jgi:hypothetical protein
VGHVDERDVGSTDMLVGRVVPQVSGDEDVCPRGHGRVEQ